MAPAPQGIDAYFGWAEADGSGIGFVDLEQAWTLDHEDLPTPVPFLGAGSLLQNDEWIAHGTAVLVAAVDQGRHKNRPALWRARCQPVVRPA